MITDTILSVIFFMSYPRSFASCLLSKMIHCVLWIDLSDAQRQTLLAAMEESFGKRVRDPMRFWKCRVYFYYAEVFQSWTGAAITWGLVGTEGVEYMDKFFVRKGSPKGEGTRFLCELVQDTSLVWRTDAVLAERFYGRLVGVRTLGRHGDYMYQGTGVGRMDEALLGLIRIPSAF